jgi:hypothetical protein
MTGGRLPSLVDKEDVLIWRLRRNSVFSDIELKKMTGLGFDLYNPEPVSLSQDSHGFFWGSKYSRFNVAISVALAPES